MDLTLTDFTKSFLDTEVSKVKLKSMGGGAIYLRSLSRANVVRFQILAESLQSRLALNVFHNHNAALEQRDSDLDAAEDFLVMKTFCNAEGELQFKDINHYKEWSEGVKNNVIDEILHHINDNMNIFFDASKEIEEREKKKKS
jgi:hypothetical protein